MGRRMGGRRSTRMGMWKAIDVGRSAAQSSRRHPEALAKNARGHSAFPERVESAKFVIRGRYSDASAVSDVFFRDTRVSMANSMKIRDTRVWIRNR